MHHGTVAATIATRLRIPHLRDETTLLAHGGRRATKASRRAQTSRRLGHRDGHVALAAHLRAVGDAGKHVVAHELRIVVKDLVNGRACREEVEDQGYADAVPANTRLPETDARVDRDTLEQFFLP